MGATMETPCPQKDPWVLAVVATPEDMRVPMTVRFSNQLVAELIQPFWAAWQGGEFMTDASAIANTHRQRGLAWVRQAGGVRLMPLTEIPQSCSTKFPTWWHCQDRAWRVPVVVRRSVSLRAW